MGKYLRPRRGNEDVATTANIKLLDGEIFLEYPEGKGMGKSPGRIIIGNGNDTYNEKVNASTNPGDFKPFITDPSLYQPIYDDNSPSNEYHYEDSDRGKSIIESMVDAVKTLPECIGLIKKILCRHTDNLRNDNDRLNALEAKGLRTDILDMRIVEVIAKPSGYISTVQIAAPNLSGWQFFMWTQISTGSNPAEPAYFENPIAATTFLRSYKNKTLIYNINYHCYALFVKRNSPSV